MKNAASRHRLRDWRTAAVALLATAGVAVAALMANVPSRDTARTADAAYTDLTGSTSTRIGYLVPSPLYPSNRAPDLSVIAKPVHEGKAVITGTWLRQLVVARDLKGLLGD